VGDLYRTQVRRLASHLGIPRPILRAASIRPPATSLPADPLEEIPRQRLDCLLHLLVDRRASPEEALRCGFPRRMIERVLERIRASHANHSLPVIAKVSSRTLGLDFRYARDWGV
jgi:NAD+ synthase